MGTDLVVGASASASAMRVADVGFQVRWGRLILALGVSNAMTGTILGALYTVYGHGFQLDWSDSEALVDGFVKNICSSALVGAFLVTLLSVAALHIPMIRRRHTRLGISVGPLLAAPLCIWFVWYWPWILLFPLLAAVVGGLLSLAAARWVGAIGPRESQTRSLQSEGAVVSSL